jgi:hypothetical protein
VSNHNNINQLASSLHQFKHPIHAPHDFMHTCSKSGIFVPKKHFNLSTSIAIYPIPTNYHSALKDPNWLNAMQEEFNVLTDQNTCLLVPRPLGVNVVTGKLIFRHKNHSDGSLAHYKARWVVRGFAQQHGVDYEETFSPVIKPATICFVLSISSSTDWPIHQLDVKNVFLHGNLSKRVYTQQPSGFVSSSLLDYVCKLNKSLCCLKQAPHTWFLRFTSFLFKLGFHGSKSNTSLFVLHRGSSTAYLVLYVDDIILTTSTTTLLHNIIHQLCSEFVMTDICTLKHFLVISVQQTCDGLFLSQHQYASELLDRAHMSHCNPCLTPADTKSKPSLTDDQPLDNPTVTTGVSRVPFNTLDLLGMIFALSCNKLVYLCILPLIDI